MNLTASILRALRTGRGDWVSGERLAVLFECSRMTIANHIAKLKARGFDIESNPRSGHRLASERDVLDEIALESYCDVPVLYLAETDSTFRAGRALETPAIVAAARQTGAYGRRKRAFSCEEGGVYFGYKFAPQLPPTRANLITLAAGVAVCETVRSRGFDARVKFPNDCWIGTRKFCGILTECVLTADVIESANVGIGINLRNGIPAELADVATTLAEEGDVSNVTRAGLIAEIVRGLDELLAAPETIAVKVREYGMFRLGDELSLIEDGGTETARYETVDDDGYLVVRRSDGTRRRVVIGEISIRRNGLD